MTTAHPLLLATATSLATQLGSGTTISLGETLAVFVFVAGLVAWLSRKLQKIEDDIESIREELKSRPCVQSSKDCPGAK